MARVTIAQLGERIKELECEVDILSKENKNLRQELSDDIFDLGLNIKISDLTTENEKLKKELASAADELRQSVLDLTFENEKLKKELALQVEKNGRNAGRKKVIQDYQLTEMRELYSQGKSYNDIGKIYNVSGTAVRNRLLSSNKTN